MVETRANSRLVGLHVLVVDDEKDIVDTIEEVLEGVRVDYALDYDTAAGKISATRYDLAILDIMGVNGLELLEVSVARGIPSVMLTAHAMNPETLNISLTRGALGYIPKEELVRLDDFLEDLLAVHATGGSTWKRVFERLGTFFDAAFGRDWTAEYPDIVKRYGGPGRWHDQG